MSEAKIDLSFDNLHFSCEGEKNWVETQLNQVLNRIPGLIQPATAVVSRKVKPAIVETVPEADVSDINEPDVPKTKSKRGRKPKVAFASKSEPVVDEPAGAGEPLMSFLKSKNSDKNQVKKFLATAVYMHAHGTEKFSTPLVSKALKAARIEKLLNASDCLNKNEKKGFCIKDGKDFILTEEGIRSILEGK